MRLNCDLGEGAGTDDVNWDEIVMPHLHMANIACGFHASNPENMALTVKLAQNHQVSIGAHPSYPDREGFGRKSMRLPAKEIRNILHEQFNALETICRSQGASVEYVKPHGALNTDMMVDDNLCEVVMQTVAQLGGGAAFGVYEYLAQ